MWIEPLGQQLLLEPALLGDVGGGAENADHDLVRLVPLRPTGVAQPMAGAVPALDPIFRARLLAGEESLGAPLQQPEIRGLDQGRPAAQRVELGHAVAGQSLKRACHPVQDQAAIRIDAQMIDAIRSQIGERIEAPLEPPRRRHYGALGGDVAQAHHVRPIGTGERSAFDLDREPPAGRACDLQCQVDRTLSLDGVKQLGELQPRLPTPGRAPIAQLQRPRAGRSAERRPDLHR